MAIDGDRFPDRISRGARIKVARKTQIVGLVDGREERNASWRNSRRSYDVGFNVRTPDDLAEVIAFHEARRGRLGAFRFRDWLDYKSSLPSQPVAATDQVIGTGDGASDEFQLIKAYGDAAGEWVRTIRYPVPGSVLIAFDGVEQASGWTVDATTGLVTFDTAPAEDVEITAGFEFDVPVRFDTDLLQERREFEELGSIGSVPLVEVRPGDTEIGGLEQFPVDGDVMTALLLPTVPSFTGSIRDSNGTWDAGTFVSGTWYSGNEAPAVLADSAAEDGYKIRSPGGLFSIVGWDVGWRVADFLPSFDPDDGTMTITVIGDHAVEDDFGSGLSVEVSTDLGVAGSRSLVFGGEYGFRPWNSYRVGLPVGAQWLRLRFTCGNTYLIRDLRVFVSASISA